MRTCTRQGSQTPLLKGAGVCADLRTRAGSAPQDGKICHKDSVGFSAAATRNTTHENKKDYTSSGATSWLLVLFALVPKPCSREASRAGNPIAGLEAPFLLGKTGYKVHTS